MDNTQSLFTYITKTQPKVIFWDIGKVLVNIDFRTENRLVSEHFDIPYNTLRDLIRTYFHDYVSGNISNQEIDLLYQQQFGITESVTAFQKKIYDQTISINHELLDHIATHAHTYQMSIISNIFPDTLADLQQRNIFTHFVKPIFSCEVGMAKPDLDIFYYALTCFPDVHPQECLFVDDKNHNLESAQQVGLDTMRYTKYIL